MLNREGALVSDEILLKRGTDVSYAAQSLTALITKGRNIAQGGGQFGQLYNEYLMWVEEAEAVLRSLFRSSGLWRQLYSDRYWRIRQMDTGRPVRPMPLMTSEMTWHLDRLEAVAGHLREVHQNFQLPNGCAAIVPDTNVFAHYRRYDEIEWQELATSKSARLIIPLVVIDELDALSYRSREGGHTAAGVLRALQRLRGTAPPHSPVEVRSGVTLQILVDPPGHARRANADDEILTRVEYLSALVGDRILVATGDYSMRLRAQARGLRFLELPGDLRLRRKDSSAQGAS